MKEKQRVLVIGDTARSLKDFRGKLIERLSRSHRVFVFIPQIADQEFRLKLKNWGVVVYENSLDGSNISLSSDIRFVVKLIRVILKVRPNVLFAYTLKPVVYGILLGRIFRINKLVPMITGLGYTFSEEKNRNLVKRLTKKLLAISLSGKGIRLICQNRDDAETLKKEGIISSSQVVHLVNGSGVDMQHYRSSQPNTTSITFLMIARLINAKGIFEYYEAARMVKMIYPDAEFKLIGSYGRNVDAVDADLFEKIKSGKVITYLGDVEDVRPQIENASVVVLPSYYGEGIPRSLLEAMAMQRAIITCDSVGCREIIAATRPNGFLVPPKSVAPLVSKLETYIQHPQLITLHGSNGFYWAKKRFDVNLVNRVMEKIMLA